MSGGLLFAAIDVKIEHIVMEVGRGCDLRENVIVHTVRDVSKDVHVRVDDGSDLREGVRMCDVCGIVMRVGVLVCIAENDGVKMIWEVQWSSSLAVATELVGMVVVEDGSWGDMREVLVTGYL